MKNHAGDSDWASHGFWGETKPYTGHGAGLGDSMFLFNTTEDVEALIESTRVILIENQ